MPLARAHVNVLATTSSVQVLPVVSPCPSRREISDAAELFDLLSHRVFYILPQKFVDKIVSLLESFEVGTMNLGEDERQLQAERTMIEEIKKRPFLWDETLPEHKDMEKARTAWEQVGRIFGLSGKIVIMSCYRSR